MIARIVQLCLICTLLGACGASDQPSANAATVDVDSCAALAAAKPGDLLGEPISEPTSFFDATNGGVSASQCAVFAQNSNRQVTLMLRYAANETTPQSRDAVIESQTSVDTFGLGAETASAMRAGEEIDGLGEIAFTYELLGLNLMVFWDRHYQMTLTMAEFSSDAEARDMAVTLAERVIEYL